MQGFFSPEGAFARVGGLIADVFILGLVWTATTVIGLGVTLGASTTALYYVVTRRISNRAGYLLRDYWRSFKLNFKKSTAVWLLTVLLAFIIYVDFTYVMGNVTAISGTGVPGATVTVDFGGGETVSAVVADDGSWTVNAPDGTKMAFIGASIASQTEPGKQPSGMTGAAASDDISQAPVITQTDRTSVPFSMVLVPFQILLTIEVIITSLFAYAVIARFDLSFKESVKAAFLMANKHLMTSVGALILFALVVLLCLLFPPLFLFAMGIFAYMHSYLIMRLFRKYRPEIDRDPDFEEEAPRPEKRRGLFGQFGGRRP